MKLTTAIVAAILAFTASAIPIVQQNSRTPETTSTGLPFDSHSNNLESVPTITNDLSSKDQNDYRGLSPIPLSVAPNGIIAPGRLEPPVSSSSDFPNNLKDFPNITRDETHVKDEINSPRPSCSPAGLARIFGGHGPIIQPPHYVYEIYWEEHLDGIFNALCPFGKYFKFDPRLSSARSSLTPPSNILAVGGLNSTSNITTTNHLTRWSTEAYPTTNNRFTHNLAQVKAASIFEKLEIAFHQPTNNTAKHQALLYAIEKLKALSDTNPKFAVLLGERLRDLTLHSKYVRPSNTTTNSTATATKLASQDISSIPDRVNSVPKHHWTSLDWGLVSQIQELYPTWK